MWWWWWGGGGCITTMYVSLQLKFQLDSPAYSPCPYPDPAFMGLLQQAALRCNVGGVWELLKCCVDHYKINRFVPEHRTHGQYNSPASLPPFDAAAMWLCRDRVSFE